MKLLYPHLSLWRKKRSRFGISLRCSSGSFVENSTLMKKALLGLFTLALTTPAMAQWQQVHNSTTGTYTVASTKDGNVFAFQPGELLRSPDGTPGSFVAVPNQPAVAYGQIYGWKQMLFILDGALGLRRSLDYGNTWQFVNNGMIGIDSTNLDRFIPMDGNNAVVLHDGSAVNKVFVSNDNGASWSANLNMTSSQGGVDVVAKGINWFLITTATVYVSNDKGQNWNNLNVTYPNGNYGSKTYLLSDGNMIMRSGTDVMTSSDGITWTVQTTTGLPTGAQTRQFIKSPSSDSLFLVTETMPGNTWNTWMSSDKGITWAAYETGLPTNAQIANDAAMYIAHNGYMYAGVDANGVYRTTSPVSASTVGVAELNKTKISFSLSPNPATTTLQVNFRHEGSGNVEVRDLTGRVIMQQTSNGTGVVFNTENLPAGVYIVTAKTNEGSVTEKFVKQ
jgi:hypothetical protein